MNPKAQAVIEAHYLPSIQYFSKLAHYPMVWIEQHEHYEKRSYRNRCHIAGSNGLIRLSIPLLKGKNQQQNIQDTQIAFHEPWMSQHWSSIQSAYGNAPFFEYYAEALGSLYQQPIHSLFQWNLKLLELLLRFIPLETTIQLTETYQKVIPEPIADLRNTIQPKSTHQKVDHHFHPVAYPQVFSEKHGFSPNLSILDLLFCTGPQAILYLEQCWVTNPKTDRI